MKKLATLLLAAGLVFGAATGASAIDFKAKGSWFFDFSYGQGSQFMSKGRNGANVYGYGGRTNSGGAAAIDNFGTDQRVRLALEAVASEFLSGTVQFEIGDQAWGRAGTNGAAMGADGMIVKVKHAYIDWMVPNTDLKVRMGIQPISLPSFTTGSSQILGDDVAGITMDYKFNDNVRLTAMWLRPYNDNWSNAALGGSEARNNPSGYMDNMDLFGLLLPLSFDGVKVTPWMAFGFVGANTFRDGSAWNGSSSRGNNYFGNFWTRDANALAGANGSSYNSTLTGMSPAVFAGKTWKGYQGNTMAPLWLGLTGEVTMWDPFRLAWDFNYGDNFAYYQELRRSGWFLSLLAEYKLDWGTPGLYGWYSSGDQGVKNGSGRMPTLYANDTNGYSAYAFAGAAAGNSIARTGTVSTTMVGTWGIGARIKDMSFLEGLKHTLYINYFGGTNAPSMAKYIGGVNFDDNRTLNNLYTDFNNTQLGRNVPLYLTTADTALELSLVNTYKIYDNLTMVAQASYIAMFLDKSSKVWGNQQNRYGAANGGFARSFQATDAWNLNVSFVYAF